MRALWRTAALWGAGTPSAPLSAHEERQQIQVLYTMCGCRPEQLVQTAQLLLFFAKGLITPIDDQGAESDQFRAEYEAEQAEYDRLMAEYGAKQRRAGHDLH